LFQEIEELKMTDDPTAYTKSAGYSEDYSQQPTEETSLTYGSKAQEAGEFTNGSTHAAAAAQPSGPANPFTQQQYAPAQPSNPFRQ
jgi:hypothetical protein